MPYTILVIDDDRSLRETVGELLRNAGHRVLLASSGEAGLAVVQMTVPDLILLDYYMPGMNGLEVVARLKVNPVTHRIPVVAVTVASAEHADALSRAGCVGVIAKPFEPTKFLRLVEDILNATVGRSPGRSDSRPGA
jgi:CheY-like chemotaxis protein